MAYQIIKKMDFKINPSDLILVEKGAILAKNNEDTRYVQLKLKNNSQEILNKVTITILLLDEAGNEFGKQSYVYESLFVPKGESFGTKIAIPLVRTDVNAVKVIVEDNFEYVKIKPGGIEKNEKKGLEIKNIIFSVIGLVTSVIMLLILLNPEFSNLYCLFGYLFNWGTGFTALSIYSIVALALCRNLQYEQNIIWLIVVVVYTILQFLINTGAGIIGAIGLQYTVMISIFTNMLIYILAFSLIFRSNQKRYLFAIIVNGCWTLFFELTVVYQIKGYKEITEHLYFTVTSLGIILTIIYITFNVIKIFKTYKNSMYIFIGTCTVFVVLSILSSILLADRWYFGGISSEQVRVLLLYHLIPMETIAFGITSIFEMNIKFLNRQRSK